jgi:transposase-like protein
MASVRKPMTCPNCGKKISFLSSLFRRSNLSFECPHCKSRLGVSLDRSYWIRQLITVPIYLCGIVAFTEFNDLESIFSIRNLLKVLLIGVIGTYEGWKLFWILDFKDKPHK